jgi:hypothetical protein
MRKMILGACLVFAALSAQANETNDETWQQAEAKIAACFQVMDRDAALAVVNAKFSRRNPTPAHLADRSVPTDDEAVALRLRVQKTKPCREMRLAAVLAHHPLLEPAYATLYYQADQVFDYLQQQAITYGAANRLSAEALDLFKAREHLYSTSPEDEQVALANVWRELLQRGHSNPPPDTPERECSWSDLNIACE